MPSSTLQVNPKKSFRSLGMCPAGISWKTRKNWNVLDLCRFLYFKFFRRTCKPEVHRALFSFDSLPFSNLSPFKKKSNYLGDTAGSWDCVQRSYPEPGISRLIIWTYQIEKMKQNPTRRRIWKKKKKLIRMKNCLRMKNLLRIEDVPSKGTNEA